MRWSHPLCQPIRTLVHFVSTNHGTFFYAFHLGCRPMTRRDNFDCPMASEPCQLGYLYKVESMSFLIAVLSKKYRSLSILVSVQLNLLCVTFYKKFKEISGLVKSSVHAYCVCLSSTYIYICI